MALPSSPSYAPGSARALCRQLLHERRALPLVYFSPQPEPFLSVKFTETTQRVPQRMLTPIRNVDECRGLPLVHLSSEHEPVLSPTPCNHPTYPWTYLVAYAGPARRWVLFLALGGVRDGVGGQPSQPERHHRDGGDGSAS